MFICNCISAFAILPSSPQLFKGMLRRNCIFPRLPLILEVYRLKKVKLPFQESNPNPPGDRQRSLVLNYQGKLISYPPETCRSAEVKFLKISNCIFATFLKRMLPYHTHTSADNGGSLYQER
jgi:hypothetical protein